MLQPRRRRLRSFQQLLAGARALRALPTTICDNAGLDSAEIVATLRAVRGRGGGACCAWGGHNACQPVPGRPLCCACLHPPCFDAAGPPPPANCCAQDHGKAPDATCAGVDVVRGAAGDMKAMGIYESFRVKNQVVTSAVEAAEMILRVDDIIRAAPRRR